MDGTLLTAGTRALGVAKMLAAELETSDRPATAILETRLRERLGDQYTLRLHVTGPGPRPGVRPLTDAEKYRLGAPGDAQCRWRTGLLLYDLAEIAAVTTLMWLPARLTAEACIALGNGAASAGKVLTPMRREDRRALALTGHEPDPGDDGLDIAVKSSAVLVVGDWPAAIATERVTRAFTELLAGQELRADCAHDLAGTSPLVPSRDRRLNPDLERALPADSAGYTDWEHVGRLHEALFGDGEWHPVTVKARWRDRRGTAVVQLAWAIGGEAYGESYLYEAEKLREA